MTDRKPPFSLDSERLREVSLRAYLAYIEGRGIFKDRASLLPQWSLPEDLEYAPPRPQTRDPEIAGDYLWLLASLEKRSVSRQNIKNGLKVWANPESRWIFFPEQVLEAPLDEVKEVIEQGFQYRLNDFANDYVLNVERIVKQFKGHARNIVNGRTVEAARRELMKFNGIGTGIANLFIIYCTDREVARVQDPEKIRIKVDIHKARISANTDVVLPREGEVRRSVLITPLEKAYLDICEEYGLNGGKLDSALWLIGSQVCVQRDFGECVRSCPLETICTSCVEEESSSGRLRVYDSDGERVEMRRKEKTQLNLKLE